VIPNVTETSAVTGIPDFAYATESVMTPVIVPGLAAKDHVVRPEAGRISLIRRAVHIKKKRVSPEWR